MTYKERRERLRAVLAGDACVFPASVFDPLSARMAAGLGFETAMFAGSVGSLTILGDPDLTLITLSEFTEQARRICRASSIPLIVDADHGYGDALNVRRTVQELEAVGVSALTLEDTALPRGFAAGETPTSISIDEAVGKLKAALDARTDDQLVIVGRTTPAFEGGIDACLARVKAYAATGVDAIFIAGVRTASELEAIAACTSLPLMLGAALDEVDAPSLRDRCRVRVCLRGNRPFEAAMEAVYTTLRTQRGDVGASPENVIKTFSRVGEFKDLQVRFLGAKP
jgi:carboxyvinyl-carboxyphosphonate phosphorylmutase